MQKAVAADYRADPEMASFCKSDIEQFCKGVKDGGGRVAACLVSGGHQLTSSLADTAQRTQL